MIHEFRVSNFLSFKEEQVLSFEATSDRVFEDIYCVRKKANLRLLKLAIIYGANASGKSNLLKAIDFLRQLATNRPEDKTSPIDLPQFAFDPTCQNEPTTFYLSFFVRHIRHIYSLKLNQNVILEERLTFYPGTQPAVAFDRVYDKEEDKAYIDFGDKLGFDAKDKLIFEGAVFKNSTVLAAYNKANVSTTVLTEVLNWFQNQLQPMISPEDDLTVRATTLVQKEQAAKSLVLDAFWSAGLDIKDIKVEKDKKAETIVVKTISAAREQDQKITNDYLSGQVYLHYNKVTFLHETSLGKFELPIRAESAGTQRYFGLACLLYYFREKNSVVPIDELESSLHFELINHFLRTFLVNTTEAQLIFTTHDIQILAEDFLRRDVIWFTEKKEDGSTELFAYTDIKLHKNISPFNAYKIGKIGAKPELGEIYID